MKRWGYATALTAVAAAVVCLSTGPAQAAPAAHATRVALSALPTSTSAPNGGPVIVRGGTSPTRGRIGRGSGQVGTGFTLTPAKGGCPHSDDAPLVRWKAPYTEIVIVFQPGDSTGYMPTGAPQPGKPAAKAGTYSAQLECLMLTPDHQTKVDKVFTPATITLTGKQLLPGLSSNSVRRGGTLGITLPGVCGKAGVGRFTIVDLVAGSGMPNTMLQTGNATIPSSVAPGHYFVTAECETGSNDTGIEAGYSYGFRPLTVTS